MTVGTLLNDFEDGRVVLKEISDNSLIGEMPSGSPLINLIKDYDVKKWNVIKTTAQVSKICVVIDLGLNSDEEVSDNE